MTIRLGLAGLFVSLSVSLATAMGDDTSEVPSPGKTTLAFWEAIRTGSVEKAIKLASDLKGLEAGQTVAELVQEAKSRPDAAPIQVLDEKAVGEVAVVIIGEEGKSYRTGLDIDPMFLHRQDGNWKVLATPIPPLALEAVVSAAADKEKAKEELMQLGKWFTERKAAIYKEREKAAPKK